MHDIIFISSIKDSDLFKDFKKKYPFAKHASTYEEAKRKSFTKLFWLVWDDITVNDNFDFKFDVPEWDQQYIHVFKNGDYFDGICLSSKSVNVSEREFKHRFFINKKEVDIQLSVPRKYDIFYINTYEEYLTALEKSTTDLFWMTSYNLKPVDTFTFDLYFSHHNSYDRQQNHAFIHRVNDKDLYNGIFLCTKFAPLTKKEIEYKFPINRKEWDIVASGPVVYDTFSLSTYDDYLLAVTNSKTELFWNTPTDVLVDTNFKFDTYFSHDNLFDRTINHVFKNGNCFDGITLFSKNRVIGKREFDYRFLTDKKEWEVLASTPLPYDVVFISYQESNATENYNKLLEKCPTAKRVHGVKGIQQAHIEAAKLVTTAMFWVVDADAVIADDFEFNYQVAKHNQDTVHVWKSRNPINNLEYGYGGVKLLPTSLTLKMNVSKPDMTTSISPKFNAMPTVSNLTAFNTDPFNTWKSAFRECVKLASRSIHGQVDTETTERLDIWCTVGNGNYSEFAIKGALAGRMYGQENAGNIPALSLINDFDWLTEQFELVSQPSEK